MGNVVRIGDSVSCGDHAAAGSPDVFFNGLPVTHKGTPQTTGHGCFPPTVFVGSWSSTVYVNSEQVALKGKTGIAVHCCGSSCHGGIVSTCSNDVSIEE